MTALRPILVLAPPAALLAAAFALAAQPALVPAPILPLIPQLPYAALAVAAALGLVFHRGRVAFAALAFGIAYAAHRQFVAAGGAEPEARATFVALCVLTPAVIAALAWMEERRTANIHALPRLAVILAACAVPVWIVATGRTETLDWAYAPLADVRPPGATPIPQLGLLAIGAGLVAVVVATVLRRSVVIAGLAWALAAFGFALHASAARFAFPMAISAAGAVLALAVLQDTYRMAFRDELTGLPGRRALDEALKAVGRHYAVAMVDIDRFKQLNDEHGHPVGDQVLRLVASRLARVGGGGRVFRYGGEEFTVLFPGRSAEEAIPRLEAVRAEIEDYRMAIRSPSRPARHRAGRRRRGVSSTGRTLSVTVSIGVAARDLRSESPDTVIEVADQALYRAKDGGRNRVSR